VAGETNVSAALLRPSAYDSYSSDLFWPGLLARHRSNVEPPDGVSQHRAICRSRLPPEEWTRRLNRAAAELELPSASLVDVTRERWTPASDSLLGPLAPALTQVFDAAWRASVATEWSSSRESAAKRLAELQELERLAAERSLSAKEELRRLQLVAERAEPAEALRAYEVFLAAHPGDAEAHLHAGNTALAARRPDLAIPLLEKAIDLDPGHAAEATRLIAEELRAQGRESEAEPYWQRNRAALAELSAALEERLRAKSDKPLLPHGLAPHEVEAIADHLRRFPMIASATLARRDVTILPMVPCLALGVRFTKSWFWWNTEKVRTMLAAIADCPLPLQVVAQDAGAAKELSRPPAVEIYRASPVGRREQLSRWGRRSQRVLVGIGGFFLLWAAIANRGCFPECWTHANAILYLVPLILAVNLLLMAGAPDTPGRRAVACIASLFFAGFLYTKGWTGLMPFTVVALARLPTGRRPLIWAAGMSIPAVLLGWLVAQV
jgi:tetratricopeptide (TPR) repeat protein